VINVGMSSVALARATVLSALLLAACNDTTGPSIALVAPEDVEAAATSAVSARVLFTPVEGADSYRIERAIGEGAFAQVATTNTYYYDDAGLQPATVYRYRVTAARGSELGPPSVFVETFTPAAGSRQSVLIGPIAANRTLAADSQYVLRRVAKVMSGATLTIQPGTLILGDVNSPPSLLLVGRGARIIAEGTAANPIVFTSSRPFGERLAGDWGGIAIVGHHQLVPARRRRGATALRRALHGGDQR
jgi:predicted small secreted protein